MIGTLALLLALTLPIGCSESTTESGTTEAEGPADTRRDAAPEGAQDAEASDLADGDLEGAERTVVHTADLTVEVDDIDTAATAATERVLETGGHVAAETVRASGEEGPSSASLTLRVPAAEYETALAELAELGTRRSLDRESRDVTEEVADVDSRVASAEASLRRLRELLDEATSVSEILDIEEKISARQAELESLQARQRSLDERTTFSTVRLELLAAEADAETGPPESFDDALAQGWGALVALGRWVATLTGWLLPFAAVLALGVVPLWLRRRLRRRGTTVPASESADSDGVDSA